MCNLCGYLHLPFRAFPNILIKILPNYLYVLVNSLDLNIEQIEINNIYEILIFMKYYIALFKHTKYQ